MDNTTSLSAEQQDNLMKALYDAGLLSQQNQQSVDTSQSDSGNTVGNMDINTFQSLIKHAANPNALPMQEGDKMHPMDAIAKISQQLNGGSQPPAQPQLQPPQGPTSNLTAVQPQMAGQGLLSWLSKKISGKPIMYDVGNPVVGTTNAPEMGNLPDSMKPQPIGTDANGKPIYDYAALQKLQGYEGALATATAKGGISNPKYSLDQLQAIGVPAEDAIKLIAANPNGVSDKELGKYQTQNKNTTFSAMVDVRKQMVDTMQQRIVGMFEGPGAMQQAMKDAYQRSANIDRFYGVYKTVADNGFQATQVQRNLLQTEASRVIAGSGGIITDDAYNRLASGTAAQTVSDWKAWLLNQASPAEFKSFADQLKTLMDNEYQINHSLFAVGQTAAANILHNPTPPVPVRGSVPSGVPTPSLNLNSNGTIPQPKSSGRWRVIR